MTTEEKAKAYDEALEAAQKELKQDLHESGVWAIKRIFPQLTESEDERIRKEINTLYSEIDACITELLKARTDKDSEAEGKALFKMEGLMVGTLQDLSCFSDYLEKQPAEWSEEDEAMRDNILRCLQCFEGTAECKSNPSLSTSYPLYMREIDWLKSLRPPLKDKEMKLKILKYLSSRCSSLEFEEVEDYLNNLRPSWKPSEEQMKALLNIEGDLRAFQYNDKAKIIAELYEQLLKLGDRNANTQNKYDLRLH